MNTAVNPCTRNQVDSSLIACLNSAVLPFIPTLISQPFLRLPLLAAIQGVASMQHKSHILNQIYSKHNMTKMTLNNLRHDKPVYLVTLHFGVINIILECSDCSSFKHYLDQHTQHQQEIRSVNTAFDLYKYSLSPSYIFLLGKYSSHQSYSNSVSLVNPFKTSKLVTSDYQPYFNLQRHPAQLLAGISKDFSVSQLTPVTNHLNLASQLAW